jgi:hypothetical protein
MSNPEKRSCPPGQVVATLKFGVATSVFCFSEFWMGLTIVFEEYLTKENERIVLIPFASPHPSPLLLLLLLSEQLIPFVFVRRSYISPLLRCFGADAVAERFTWKCMNGERIWWRW